MKFKIKKTKIEILNADLFVNDDPLTIDNGDTYNFPRILVKGVIINDTYVQTDLYIHLKFQRNSLNEACSRAKANGFMDTKRPWSTCYGGSVWLGLDTIGIFRTFKLSIEDLAKIKFANLISKTIPKFNIHRTTECECVQVCEALIKLGVPLVKYYGTQANHTEMTTVSDLRCNLRNNEKAEKEE